MNELADNLRTRLRASLWFIPTLCAIAALALAVLAVTADRVIPASYGGLWGHLFAGGGSGAAGLLTAVAGGMITVTGVAFSVTIVSLSMASSQFGPRLLRTFMRDRGNQWVLGVFVATFLYCLVALVMVPQGDEGAAPRAVVALALLLTFASVGALIFFIHHVSVLIQADSVLARVADQLESLLEHFFPGDAGDEPPVDALDEHGVPREMPDWEDADEVGLQRGGYIEAVDVERLLELAQGTGVVLRVVRRPGQFVVAGTTVVQAAPGGRLNEKQEERIRRAVRLGPRRTEEQDVEFAIDQLVEVGVRAMSPGINDPFTAMSVADRLGSALCRLGPSAIPSPYRYRGGRLLVVVKRSSYEGIVDKALDQLRQFGSRSVAVLLRLMGVLRATALCTPDPARRRVLRHHADKLMADARRSVASEPDLAEVESRYRDVLEALAAPTRSRLPGGGAQGGDRSGRVGAARPSGTPAPTRG